MAKETGQIRALGEWVIREVRGTIAHWPALPAGASLPVSVKDAGQAALQLLDMDALRKLTSEEVASSGAVRERKASSWRLWNREYPPLT